MTPRAKHIFAITSSAIATLALSVVINNANSSSSRYLDPTSAAQKICVVSSDSLPNTQNKFNSICSQTYDKNKGQDCDQTAEGRWLCATKLEYRAHQLSKTIP